MKKLIVVVLFLVITFPVLAQTHWSVEAQRVSTKNTRGDLIGVFTNHSFKNSPYGVWSFAEITPSWTKYLIGPSYNVSIDSVYAQWGIGIGIEQSSFTPQFAISLFIKDHKASGTFFVQFGKDAEYWYLFNFVYRITPLLGFGFHSQQDMGIGPQVKITKDPAYLWAAPVWNRKIESWGIAIGGGLEF